MDRTVIEQMLMPVTYGRHLARRFPVGPLLAGTGLNPQELEHRDRRITVGQALQYVKNALALGEEPDWYLAWASSLSDHFHGPISLALMSAPTLGDALYAFIRFFPGRVPYLHLHGQREGEWFRAELQPLIDLDASTPLLVETPLIILQQYLDTVYGVDLRQTRVTLAYPPTPYAGCYARYFHGAVQFGALRHALEVPVAWLARRNLEFQASSWAHALAQCEATLASSVERSTLGDLQRLLSIAFAKPERERALPTLAEVARELHLAPRTLIRRLRHLGTTYQAVTDDFLRARALELLANDGVKIKAVAAALGFTNPANFGKAFKRWFGVSPGQYRAGDGRR